MLDLDFTAAANVRRVRWIALGSAELMSAVGEFHLATEIGIAPWLAWLLPVALGIYGYCAFAAGNRADVCAALALMVICQGLAHLLAVELIPRHWTLIIAVSAVAPIVCWRVHHLGQHTPEAPAPVDAAPVAGIRPVMVDKPAAPVPPIDAPAPIPAEPTADDSDHGAAPTRPVRRPAAETRKLATEIAATEPGITREQLAARLNISPRRLRTVLNAA
ncbi:MAG TPA: hypothetical protein VF755_01055 [Catenuloplanes sp.]|jgi:hypothetical protein